MRSMRTGLLACAAGVCLAIPIAGGARAQDSSESAPEDVIRTRLTLELRPVTVTFPSALGAEDPAHRELLSGRGSASGVRARVGEMDVLPLLRIGTLDGTAPGGSESENPRSTKYALWLARTGADWALELEAVPRDDAGADEDAGAGEDADASHDADEDAGDDDAGHDEAGHDEGEHDESEHHEAGHDETGEEHAAAADSHAGGVIGRIPLSPETAGVQADFSAALLPTGEGAGQLVLRWRDHRWTADFRFAEPPEDEEEEEPEEEDEEEDRGPRVANERESLSFDADNFTARFSRLAERDETAIELPGDSSIAVLFWQEQSVEHADFAALETLADGEVVRLTEAAVIRLRSEVPLRIGGATLPTGNLSPGFAGSYGLWLKRSGDGWRLAFNHEADSWGTQHDPAFDAAEIDVAYSAGGLETRPLGAALVPATARDGRLVIHWGPHEWAADYEIPE